MTVYIIPNYLILWVLNIPLIFRSQPQEYQQAGIMNDDVTKLNNFTLTYLVITLLQFTKHLIFIKNN